MTVVVPGFCSHFQNKENIMLRRSSLHWAAVSSFNSLLHLQRCYFQELFEQSRFRCHRDLPDCVLWDQKVWYQAVLKKTRKSYCAAVTEDADDSTADDVDSGIEEPEDQKVPAIAIVAIIQIHTQPPAEQRKANNNEQQWKESCKLTINSKNEQQQQQQQQQQEDTKIKNKGQQHTTTNNITKNNTDWYQQDNEQQTNRHRST